MAEPINPLIPDGFNEEELEEYAPEEIIDQDQEPSQLDQLKQDLTEKAKEQWRNSREQSQLRNDESKKPPKIDSPELAQKKQEKATEAADRVKAGEQKLQKTAGQKAGSLSGGAKPGLASIAGGIKPGSNKEDKKEQVKEAVKDQAKQEAKQYAKQVAKQLSRALAQAIKAFIADNPIAWAVIGIILLIIIIIAIIFAIFAINGNGGKGPAQYPTSALQRQEANFLLAISGDKIAQDTAVKEVIDSELERYDRIKANADHYNPTLSAKIVAKKTTLSTELHGLLAEQDITRRKQLSTSIRKEMMDFESTLPFGNWIANLAEANVGQRNAGFCLITGASSKVACASFTSTILYKAGVPNPIVPAVDQIWTNSAIPILVPRPASKSAGYYQANAGKLKAGDIIFWGDGTCSPSGSLLFDHVGFYVGGGMAVDTSSNDGIVEKRTAAKRDSCRVFNGAKRYGN